MTSKKTKSGESIERSLGGGGGGGGLGGGLENQNRDR